VAVLGPLAGPRQIAASPTCRTLNTLPGRNLDSAEQKKSGVRRLSAGRNLRFCQALHEAAASRRRYTTIAALARRLGLDEREAIALATDCAAAGYVQLNVKGPPYAQSPESASNGQAVPRNAPGRVLWQSGVRNRALSASSRTELQPSSQTLTIAQQGRA
jgi:hypothetical protein